MHFMWEVFRIIINIYQKYDVSDIKCGSGLWGLKKNGVFPVSLAAFRSSEAGKTQKRAYID